MGHQIIKQPNGKFAVWSTNQDDFLLLDATQGEIVQYYEDRARRTARENTEAIFAELEAGGKPYYQFTMGWDEALMEYKRVHKKDSEITFDADGQLQGNG